MNRRQPQPKRLPRLWMMTDERQGDALWTALERLPRSAGVVFRHYSLAPAARRALFRKVRAIAHRRGLRLLLAGPPQLAAAWGADGSHGRRPAGRGMGLASAPVHDLREIRAAERAGARLLFLSPVFQTRSHPQAAALGPLRFAGLARQTALPVIALGGMSAARARRLGASGLYGWAAIDAWTRHDADDR
ncbi:thiamine phosphate synthase [Sphingomonas sp.]|uniref:thiamine phosphate synthase n=1 Tax=Sphingomonas sp. TaxID=28214 RepID=UPI002FCB437B